MDWNDLRLFAALARTGGLGAAARAAGVSAATLGRRVQALEAALGKRLVERRPEGYALTADGQALAARVEAMETAAHGIARWRDLGRPGRVVRISAGSWTAHFLAGHWAALARPGDAFRLEFLPAEEMLDIGRRAADIGLRARRPEEAWLAGRRLGAVAYAVYGRPEAPEGFVAPTETITRAARWLRAHHGAAIVLEASSPRLVLDLVEAGAGRALLPCFVGDARPGLVRFGAPVTEALTEQWLVMHHDERHAPPVRAVAARIVRLLQANRGRLMGEPAGA